MPFLLRSPSGKAYMGASISDGLPAYGPNGRCLYWRSILVLLLNSRRGYARDWALLGVWNYSKACQKCILENKFQLWAQRVALLTHGSVIWSWAQGYCLCGVLIFSGSPPIFRKHDSRQIYSSHLSLGVCERERERSCPADVPSRVPYTQYSRIGSGSTAHLTRIKLVLKKNDDGPGLGGTAVA